jgi:hypothetical protein
LPRSSTLLRRAARYREQLDLANAARP